MQAQFQSSVHSSNFVMTAAAQNLLCLQMAASVGVTLDDPFLTWLSGSCVPVLLGEDCNCYFFLVLRCYLALLIWCFCCIDVTGACLSSVVSSKHMRNMPNRTKAMVGRWLAVGVGHVPDSTAGPSRLTPTIRHMLIACCTVFYCLLHCVVLLAGVVLTPCVLYWLWPPAISSTPQAPAAAKARLQEMGPLTADEGVMMGAVTMAVGLWVGGTLHKSVL
jgi:hypothetical protein